MGIGLEVVVFANLHLKVLDVWVAELQYIATSQTNQMVMMFVAESVLVMSVALPEADLFHEAA